MNNKGPVRKDKIQSRKLGDEWLLYNSKTGSIQVINAMAEFVWEMCDGCHSIEEMERRVSEAYSVPAGSDVKKDLDEIIQSFANKGLLEGEEA